MSLIVIASGLYIRFVPALAASAAEHVAGLHRIYVLSDEKPAEPIGDAVMWLPWGHMAWPLPTLLRYRAITAYREVFADSDVLLYVDADMVVRSTLDLRGADGMIAVQHPGYVGVPPEHLPYERRPESRASIAVTEGGVYVAGGVQGGEALAYLDACAHMARWVQQDLDRDIVPIWHDESIWNRYCASHPPSVLLPATYCSPEEREDAEAVIVALKKDHDRMRQVPTLRRWSRRIKLARRRCVAAARRAVRATVRRV